MRRATKRDRAIKVRIHFNKPKSGQGLPWTVHTSKACIPASEVRILVPTETVFQPDKKDNPRAWISARGIVEIQGTVVTIK